MRAVSLVKRFWMVYLPAAVFMGLYLVMLPRAGVTGLEFLLEALWRTLPLVAGIFVGVSFAVTIPALNAGEEG